MHPPHQTFNEHSYRIWNCLHIAITTIMRRSNLFSQQLMATSKQIITNADGEKNNQFVERNRGPGATPATWFMLTTKSRSPNSDGTILIRGVIEYLSKKCSWQWWNSVRMGKVVTCWCVFFFSLSSFFYSLLSARNNNRCSIYIRWICSLKLYTYITRIERWIIARVCSVNVSLSRWQQKMMAIAIGACKSELIQTVRMKYARIKATNTHFSNCDRQHWNHVEALAWNRSGCGCALEYRSSEYLFSIILSMHQLAAPIRAHSFSPFIFVTALHLNRFDAIAVKLISIDSV